MTAAIRIGDTLTNRDGTLSRKAAMTFAPPHVVFDGGFAIADYGDDEKAAFDHYDQLIAAQWRGQVRFAAAGA